MNPVELARAFQSGRLVGPKGPLAARRATITRKSVLLYTDDLVLKLRRPRFVDDQDQSLISVRHALVGRERFIGRHLSPDVYLEDVTLDFDEARDVFVLQPGWVTGEPVVLMRRLPDEQRADHVLLSGIATSRILDQLEMAMQHLASFHANAEFHTEAPYADPATPGRRFEAALERLGAALSEDERTTLVTETSAWLERLAPSFEHRIIERRVRSLHGEIRLEHLFLPGMARVHGRAPVAFIDPDDGPDEGRMLDTAEDVVPLALELEAILGAAASDRVVDAYAGQTGDGSLRKVARFYKRLGCLRRAAEALDEAAEPDADPTEGRERARFFIERALGV